MDKDNKIVPLKCKDNFHEDLEVRGNELKGVFYTGISFIAFLLFLISGTVYLVFNFFATNP